MKALISILLFVFVQGTLTAQTAPGFTWKKVFGGKKDEKALDVAATYDGKIAVVGSTTSEPAKGKDALFLLLDMNGQQVKQVLTGGAGDDVLRAIAPTWDGGVVLAGETDTKGHGKMDGWLVKVNEKGDTLWQKTLGTDGKEFFNDILQTSDGGLLAVGSAERSEGKTDMWVCKTYADGSLQWQNFYGNRGTDEARSAVEDANGNIAISGITSQGKGGRNIWLFIIDKNGKPLQHRIFGSREYEEVTRIVATRDGGFALAGYAKAGNDGGGLKDFWLIKTASDGEMIWQTTLGGRSNDSASGMTETTDGGLVLVGYTFSHLIGANTTNALIVKVDANGKTVWQTDEPGGKDNDELTAATLLPDGSLVFAGTTSSKQEEAQGEDFWVMRMSRETEVNTAIPTQLVLSNLKLLDKGDGILEEGEEAFLSMTLANKGQQDAYDVDVILQETNAVKNLSFTNFRKMGFLPAGKTQQLLLPIKGLEGLPLSDAMFEAFCTDASRSRSQSATLKVMTRPLNLPSDFLDITWLSPLAEKGQSGAVVKTRITSIRLRTRSDRKLNRSHFTVLLNGEPYKVGQKAGESGLSDKGTVRNIFTYEYTHQLELRPGKNTVEAIVQNGDKKVSSPILEIEYSDKPNLHVLAIGIEHDDLKYTVQDAKDFAASFAGQDGRLFDKVYLTTLVSGVRTRSGIFQTEGEVVKKIFRDMKDHYQYTIYEQDLLLVFLSSHGKTVSNTFKIIPTDFAMAGEQSLIDYQNDIIKQLDPLRCRKLVFVDACHSGSFDTSQKESGDAAALVNGTSKALLETSAAANGTSTLASCRADESSWEDAHWGNGAFTEAILSAFNNEVYKDTNGEFAPTSGDDILTIGELFVYLQRRVPQMLLETGKQGSQHPFISYEQLGKVKDVAVYRVK
jgi:hypothetical protein